MAKAITAILLVFVAVSVIFAVIPRGNEPDRSEAASNEPANVAVDPAEGPAETVADSTEPVEDHFVAYYFHGDARCTSCRNIEAYTAAALKENFGKELEDGSLVWKAVNVDQRGNEHFVQDYRLSTKSVILSEIKNGKEARWKNLDQVWMLLRDKAAFQDYIKAQTAEFLEDNE